MEVVMDLVSFLDRYPSQGACFAHLEAVRWPSGPVCPKCGVINDALRLPKREGYWMCRACRAQFTVLHGTPMEGTHLPLRTWFGAIFLLATSSKGVSSMVISRQLGIGYKTAWFLTHRLRAMMEQDWEKLRGIVEADETYVGGKKRKKGQASKRDSDDDQPKGRGGSRKMMATVAVERGGKARVRKGRTHSERTIAAFVYDVVDRSAVLSTDDLPAYRWIGRKFAAHLRVNHTGDEFVRVDPHAAATAHVNTAESFNATLKRAVIGVWHWFSIKHADRYLDEVAFRWNHRGCDAGARLHDMFRTRGRRIRFRELVA
jgi:transposase-like protein